jgi:hypothetical protein
MIASIIAYTMSAICILFAVVSFTDDIKAATNKTLTPFKARNGMAVFFGLASLGWLFAYLGGIS